VSTVINRGARLKYKGSGRAILEGIMFLLFPGRTLSRPLTSRACSMSNTVAPIIVSDETVKANIVAAQRLKTASTLNTTTPDFV
jgi:hypothetical protein